MTAALAVLATWAVVTNWRSQSTTTTVANQPTVSTAETKAHDVTPSTTKPISPTIAPPSIERKPPATDASPPPTQGPPEPVVAVLYSVDRSASDMLSAKPLRTAVQVGKRHFAVRALTLLTHGVKDPATDPNKLIVGARTVIKATYHPKLPLASLANEKLSDSELVAMVLYDVAVLEIDGDLSEAPFPPLVSLSVLGVDPLPVVCVTAYLEPNASKVSRLAGMAKRHGGKANSMVGDVDGSYLPMHDGAPVLDQTGKLFGILMVQIDADGKSKPPHNILSWDRVAETLATVQ